jgi:hypothetical protein
MSDYSGVDLTRTRVIMGLSRRCIGAVPSASLALWIVGCVIASLGRALPRACGGFLLARGEPSSVPGAGLAIRIPGPITREKLGLLRQVDAVYLDKIWQAFAVLLPVRTVA